MKNGIVLVGVGMLLIAGCGQSDEKPLAKKTGFDALADDSVLMRVEGRDLTKRDFIGYTVLRTELFKLGNPKAKPEDVRSTAENTTKQCAVDFVQNTIILDSAQRWRKAKGELAETQIKEAAEKVKKGYAYKGSLQKTERVMERAGILPYFRNRMQEETLMEAYLTGAFTNFRPVTSAGISNYYAMVVDHNARAEATNRFILAQAKNVLKAIENGTEFAGADFAALADRYSMDPQKNPGGDMGECDQNDFAGDEAKLWDEISKLKVGGVTGIIDADDSWQIYHLDEIVPADKSATQQEARRLSRIYFRKAVIIERLSEDEVRELMEKMRRQDISTWVIEAYLPDLKVEYPNGSVIPAEELEPFKRRAEELAAKIKLQGTNNVEKVKVP